MPPKRTKRRVATTNVRDEVPTEDVSTASPLPPSTPPPPPTDATQAPPREKRVTGKRTQRVVRFLSRGLTSLEAFVVFALLLLGSNETTGEPFTWEWSSLAMKAVAQLKTYQLWSFFGQYVTFITAIPFYCAVFFNLDPEPSSYSVFTFGIVRATMLILLHWNSFSIQVFDGLPTFMYAGVWGLSGLLAVAGQIERYTMERH